MLNELIRRYSRDSKCSCEPGTATQSHDDLRDIVDNGVEAVLHVINGVSELREAATSAGSCRRNLF